MDCVSWNIIVLYVSLFSYCLHGTHADIKFMTIEIKGENANSSNLQDDLKVDIHGLLKDETKVTINDSCSKTLRHSDCVSGSCISSVTCDGRNITLRFEVKDHEFVFAKLYVFVALSVLAIAVIAAIVIALCCMYRRRHKQLKENTVDECNGKDKVNAMNNYPCVDNDPNNDTYVAYDNVYN